jgi:hypothetical protein
VDMTGLLSARFFSIAPLLLLGRSRATILPIPRLTSGSAGNQAYAFKL